MGRFDVLLAVLLTLSCRAYADSEVNVGGLIEVGYEKIGEEVGNLKTGDIELGFKARLNEKVSGRIGLRLDGLPEAEALDEATITLERFSEFPFFVTMGKTVMPFGVFNSHLISDPWTKENKVVTWETKAVGLVGGYAHKQVEVSCALYDSSDLKDPEALAAQISLKPTEGVTFGASYKSYHDVKNNEVLGYTDLSVMTEMVWKKMTLDGEYIVATKREENAPKPSAYSVGLAFQATESLELAVRYDKLNDDDEDRIRPDSRIGAGLNYTLFEAVTLGVEYGHTKKEEDGKGKDELLAKWAIKF
ncbi:TPA: hypothetical protein DCX15_01470 [bacterium]|nr:hypothetical protein [bacterium]